MTMTIDPEKTLERVIKIALWATALTPLVMRWNAFFPFVFPKMLFFRGAVSLGLLAALVLWGWHAWKGRAGLRVSFGKLRSALVLPLAVYFILLAASTALAENPYRAFWGDVERTEGFFGMAHYVAFLGLAVSFFRKEDWITFFKISIAGGVVLLFYAVLEYAGVKNFPFAVPPNQRPGSLVGNSAFFATHLLFLIMFSCIVFWDALKEGGASRVSRQGWMWGSLAFAVLATLGIFLTGTRGAILGLAVGIVLFCLFVLFSRNASGAKHPVDAFLEKKFARRIAAAALLGLLVFGGVFFATRDAEVWKHIPGFDRLARTARFDTVDTSTQLRIITWRVSWEAFKERPLFGWGPENYLVAYQKHYDPTYALYGETWLDRAHNKIFDLLVMQGAFGLIAYLWLLVALMRALFRRAPARFLLVSGVVAYFVQNLVLFDQILSYLALFALIGFAMEHEKNSGLAEGEPALTAGHPSGGERKGFALNGRVTVALAAIFSIGVVFVVYRYSYVPYVQAVTFWKSPGSSRVDLVADALRRAMHPYNFAQYNIRAQGADSIYFDQYFYNETYVTNPNFRSIGDLLVEGMDELARREPYDVRVLIREVQMLDALAKTDPSLYQRAEDVLRKAAEIAPRRQEVFYHLAINLAKQGRFEESIATGKYAVDLEPRAARAHFHYALVLAAAGRDAEGQAELRKVEELDPAFRTLLGTDHNSVAMLYNAWGMQEKVADLAMKKVQGLIAPNFNIENYRIAMQYFAEQKDKESFVTLARFLGEKNPAIKEDLDIFIDLAEKGLWDVILSL